MSQQPPQMAPSQNDVQSKNDTQSSPSSTKTHITTHMNSLYRDSLSLFLRHYCHVPASSAQPSTTTLTTLTSDSLIIFQEREKRRYYIPLSPPLPALSCPTFSAEIRHRIKDMHYASLAGLDLSPTKITRYAGPRTVIEVVVFVLVGLTMISFSWRGNFQQGSIFYQTLGLGYVHGFAGFCYVIQPWLLGGMSGIHAGEVVWMARTRLRRHRVESGSRLWWMWMGTCFMEGYSSFRRFDRLVREIERKEKR